MPSSQVTPLDTSIRAEYEDGFILDETEHGDTNPYCERGNTLTAILERYPEREHGRLVCLTVFWHNYRYDIDWRNVPDEAIPIRLRHGFLTESPTVSTSGFSGVDFGYSYIDIDGNERNVIEELR